jgi:Fe-S oxidoreductase
MNIELSLKNKIELMGELEAFFLGELPVHQEADAVAARDLLGGRPESALGTIRDTCSRWRWVLDHLDAPIGDYQAAFPAAADAFPVTDPESCSVFHALQDHRLRISWKAEVREPLMQVFDGRTFEAVRSKMEEIHKRVLKSRLFIALHMHAGDGNVHTNIPVNSDDYGMLQEANQAVRRVMALAKSLGGVISGEHGIGITKLDYLEPEQVESFAAYKSRIDPKGRFNKGKLLSGANLDRAYTPSFSLLEQESLILEQSDIGAVSDSIKDCLRCGKCKPVCSTHVPRANLMYSPRNKILATSLLIEAFLYEEQTRRGISIRHFDEFGDVADHCTVCHKCESPCPVDIDFGDVSIAMRNMLRKLGKRKLNVGTSAAMLFLNASDPRTIKLSRKLMIDWGYRVQRAAHRVAKRFGLLGDQLKHPPATLGRPPVRAQIVHFLNKPMPGGLPKKTSRALLDIEDRSFVPVIRNLQKITDDSDSVFYFPGCGSERLFGQVGLATQAMLYEIGAITVLPPGYLCCGYPQTAAGEAERGRKIITDNRVLFHRVANTLNYLDIKTVIVSCGTCHDQLQHYEFDKIFPGCRLLDIHEYLLEKGVKLDGIEGVRYLYHDPCHSPMKTYQPIKVVNGLMGQDVALSDRCCGESGTLAMTRPDISTQVRFRKQEEMQEGARLVRGDRYEGKVKVLTSCPSCLQGLSRYDSDSGTTADYIVVEVARHLLGSDWMRRYVDSANRGGIERVLL